MALAKVNWVQLVPWASYVGCWGRNLGRDRVLIVDLHWLEITEAIVMSVVRYGCIDFGVARVATRIISAFLV
jgi:hypothetical protein